MIGTPKKQSSGQILDTFGVRGILNAVSGWRVRNLRWKTALPMRVPNWENSLGPEGCAKGAEQASCGETVVPNAKWTATCSQSILRL